MTYLRRTDRVLHQMYKQVDGVPFFPLAIFYRDSGDGSFLRLPHFPRQVNFKPEEWSSVAEWVVRDFEWGQRDFHDYDGGQLILDGGSVLVPDRVEHPRAYLAGRFETHPYMVNGGMIHLIHSYVRHANMVIGQKLEL